MNEAIEFLIYAAAFWLVVNALGEISRGAHAWKRLIEDLRAERF